MTPYRAILAAIALERFAWYCFLGIERDRWFSSLDEATAYYERESRWLSGLVLVDREVLLGMGFVWA